MASAPSRWAGRFRLLGRLALIVALGVWPLAFVLEGQAQTLQLIAPFDEATVNANRAIFDPQDAKDEREVVAIYGTAYGAPQRILFAREADVIRPAENPDLRLLRKAGAENPLQMQTVWFVTPLLSVGAALMGLALLWLARRLGRSTS